MFSSISPSSGRSSRQTATLCSTAVHAAAVAAVWAASQVITAPPIPQHQRQEALLVVSPPPRLFRPRSQPKTAVQRLEIERAAATQTPEAIREAPQAPTLEAQADPAPILPSEPPAVVPNAAAKPTGFAAVARATAPKLELEPRAAAFGAALGKLETPTVAPTGGAAGFGTVGLARMQSSVVATGDSGFGDVEIGRAARPAATAGEAGFGAAQRRPAAAVAGEPTSARSKNRPMKILWKPVPKYSEEGIRRRIEGDVVLLVRFLAQGTVETLEVVRGLGYGLDEYALQAVQSIRFEPAVEGDRAVDYTTQVHIRFELAY